MAGPTGSILLPRQVVDTEVWAISEAPAQIVPQSPLVADTQHVADFSIDEQPFAVYHGWREGLKPEEFQRDDLTQWLGWTPADIIDVIAFCSGDVNHRLLAQLCVYYARQLGGVVDLGGCPFSYFTAPALAGRCIQLPYEAASGETCFSTYCDAEYLESWLKEPGFRMVK